MFLADDTSAAPPAAPPPPAGGEHAAAEAEQPVEAVPAVAAAGARLLAVRLVGSPAAVDWLAPSCSASGSPASGAAAAAARQQHAAERPKLLSCRNLLLSSLDAANGLWVAAAPDTAALSVASVTSIAAAGAGRRSSVGSAASQRAQQLSTWALAQQPLLAALQARVQHLVEGT